MNRLSDAITRARVKVNSLDPVARQNLEETLELTLEEVFAYQNAKTRAMLNGIITQEEAQLIYAAIGEGGSWPKRTDLATKVIVTLALEEILTKIVALEGAKNV